MKTQDENDARQLKPILIIMPLHVRKRIRAWWICRQETYTHVRIDPSVKVIAAYAFASCKQLEYLELCEGIELIDQMAFKGCISLTIVRIAAKIIGRWAFGACFQLNDVDLCEGDEKNELIQSMI